MKSEGDLKREMDELVRRLNELCIERDEATRVYQRTINHANESDWIPHIKSIEALLNKTKTKFHSFIFYLWVLLIKKKYSTNRCRLSFRSVIS